MTAQDQQDSDLIDSIYYKVTQTDCLTLMVGGLEVPLASQLKRDTFLDFLNTRQKYADSLAFKTTFLECVLLMPYSQQYALTSQELDFLVRSHPANNTLHSYRPLLSYCLHSAHLDILPSTYDYLLANTNLNVLDKSNVISLSKGINHPVTGSRGLSVEQFRFLFSHTYTVPAALIETLKTNFNLFDEALGLRLEELEELFKYKTHHVVYPELGSIVTIELPGGTRKEVTLQEQLDKNLALLQAMHIKKEKSLIESSLTPLESVCPTQVQPGIIHKI